MISAFPSVFIFTVIFHMIQLFFLRPFFHNSFLLNGSFIFTIHFHFHDTFPRHFEKKKDIWTFNNWFCFIFCSFLMIPLFSCHVTTSLNIKHK